MKDLSVTLVFIGVCMIPVLAYYFFSSKKAPTPLCIQSVEEIINLFPNDVQAIEKMADRAEQEVKRSVEAICSIPSSSRTFKNTMASLDEASTHFLTQMSLLHVLTLVSPSAKIRDAAQEKIVKLQSIAVDNFSLNRKLFEACVAYEKLLENADFREKEALTATQDYFIKQTMHDFYRGGIHLPEETREKIRALHKELTPHIMQFDLNIAASQPFLSVKRDDLKGCNESFVNGLKKTDAGFYILAADMPTYVTILEECAVEKTRKAYYKMFTQRAYPENEREIDALIDLQDQLAKLLQYPSYAHYDIDNQMAKTPERVRAFIEEVAQRAQLKADQEAKLLKNNLPEGVRLTQNGLFQPWDYVFIKNAYKKQHLAVDESLIKEFFPVEHVLPALFNIYEKFFGITFKKLDAHAPWHDDTQMLAVYKEGKYKGTVILDLHPRPFKYVSAVEVSIIQPRKTAQGHEYPSLILVIANFPSSKPDQPALLTRHDVLVFFHEFGHAIHDLLGATQLGSFAGTLVKRDFVEMPSQMLEEWMWDANILKMVSSHYKTKEPLSDEMIAQIQAVKNFDSGETAMRQLALASVSLEYFLPGAHKDIAGIWKKNQTSYRKSVSFDEDNKGFASFNHITHYGAKYYGYMWSKVYALDLFYYIKPYGLLDRQIGERYTKEVIGKGGSQEPMELLRNFLGREPNSEAFFKDLGL